MWVRGLRVQVIGSWEVYGGAKDLLFHQEATKALPDSGWSVVVAYCLVWVCRIGSSVLVPWVAFVICLNGLGCSLFWGAAFF